MNIKKNSFRSEIIENPINKKTNVTLLQLNLVIARSIIIYLPLMNAIPNVVNIEIFLQVVCRTKEAKLLIICKGYHTSLVCAAYMRVLTRQLLLSLFHVLSSFGDNSLNC